MNSIATRLTKVFSFRVCIGHCTIASAALRPRSTRARSATNFATRTFIPPPPLLATSWHVPRTRAWGATIVSWSTTSKWIVLGLCSRQPTPHTTLTWLCLQRLQTILITAAFQTHTIIFKCQRFIFHLCICFYDASLAFYRYWFRLSTHLAFLLVLVLLKWILHFNLDTVSTCFRFLMRATSCVYFS